MWKISRNFIFPRWHANKGYADSTHKAVVPPKAVTMTSTFEKKKHSDESSNKGKERFNKQSKRYWNCEQFQYLLSRSFFLETAGWLGTVTVLCFNFHFKHFSSFYKNEQSKASCLFSRNVLAMPKGPERRDNLNSEAITVEPSPLTDSERNKVESPVDDLNRSTIQYAAAMQNSAGLSILDSNCKKAFRYFQSAARLGSCQAFYNLGLCYELGKGTRVNLNRAAFCYRKAAMKGHGLASYNLAIYFFKGIGGLPVDQDTAKLLLAEAAEKDIPEAQLYIGLECLEENKWCEAFQIFSSLNKKEVLPGKYFLGVCYENGWGIERDEKVALELFSEGASLGHSKSILRLSKCYEDGFGGCSRDLDFALALCQIVADQGDEEGASLVQRLKAKQQEKKAQALQKPPTLTRQKSSLHSSSSFPKISENKNQSSAVYSHGSLKPIVSAAYLDLITPFFPQAANKKAANLSKPMGAPMFFVGDSSVDSLPSPAFLQAPSLPLMTAAKT